MKITDTIRHLLRSGLIAAIVLVVTGVPAVVSAATPPQAAFGLSHRPVCAAPAALHAQCNSEIVTNGNTGKPQATTSYSSGYGPADLQSAYALPGTASGSFSWNGQTVAIVDAYDNPNTMNDLLAYRQQFGLPLCSTSTTTPTANDLVGCLFTKVNQSGQASPTPTTDTGWGQEIDLDLDIASATCPNCKILLVEANSNAYTDLGAAVDQAAAMGANSISNSYGGSEFSAETSSTYNGHYNHPGIAVTASSGDNGYGVEFPAASQYVTAVGGTSLNRSNTTTRGWTETAWSGAGSGCSSYVGRLSYQPTIGTCTQRIIADVSAVADPYTGVAVYDSFGSTNGANWYVFGGTSVASPIIASVYALAGNTGGSTPAIQYGEYPYAHKAALNDVTSGSNGQCTTTSRRTKNSNLALCTAVSGFDGPTGLGTPKGVAAF